MRQDDARKLDHTTLEAMRIRAVRSVQAGENPETVARSSRTGHHAGRVVPESRPGAGLRRPREPLPLRFRIVSRNVPSVSEIRGL
jgi:hypothetical protein